MSARDLANDGQPESRAGGAARGGRALKRLEDASTVRRRHAGAGILDDESRRVLHARYADGGGPAAVQTCILEQVAHEASQETRIAMHDQRLAADLAIEPGRFLRA